MKRFSSRLIQSYKIVYYSTSSPWKSSLSSSFASLSSSFSSLSTPSPLTQLHPSSPSSLSSPSSSSPTFTNGEVIEWTKEDSTQLRILKNTLTNYAYQFIPKYGLIYCHIPASLFSFMGGSTGDAGIAFVFFNMLAFAFWYSGYKGTVTNPAGGQSYMGSVFLLNRAKAEARQDQKMANVVSKINALEAKRDYVNQQEHEKYLNRKV